MASKIEWHPEGFLAELHTTLGNKLEESAEVVKSNAKDICPVKTGRLRDSIEADTDKDELIATIGSEVEYAPMIELGTRKIAPRRFLTKGLYASVSAIVSIFSSK